MRPAANADRSAVLYIAIAAVAVRLLAGASIPLTEDEAYYRLWAQHPQWGYFDHPPMIAWWIWAGVRTLGDTPLGVRLLPALAMGASTWLVGDLARRLGKDAATAARAALWYNLTLTVALGGFLATPDAPASLFWILTVWCLSGPRAETARWWAFAGVAAGLGTISKYSDLFLAPGVLAWLLLSVEGRTKLARPAPWTAALLASAIFATNLVWNAQHDWITFAKQFGRAAATGLNLDYLPEFLLTQFFLFNPIMAGFLWQGASQSLQRWRRGDPPPELMPLMTALPLLGYLLLHSFHDRVQGHWPVPVYAPLAMCAAIAAASAHGSLAMSLRRQAPLLGIGVALIAFVHLAFPKIGSFGVSDPALALSDWPRFASEVERARESNHASWVGTLSYGLAAQLDAQKRSRAPILQVNERARYREFGTRRRDLTRPGLLLDLDRRTDLADLERCFTVVEPVGDLERGFKAGPAARYSLFRVAQPRLDLWSDGCRMRNEMLPHF